MQVRSGQASGSGLAFDSDLELGRVQGRQVGLSLDKVGLSPSSTNRPPLHRPNSAVPSFLKVEVARIGFELRQGLLSRPVLPSKCKSPISSTPNARKEGKAIHIW